MDKELRIAIPAKAEDTVNYAAALKNLGALPVLVDASCNPEAFDGLLLPGGADVDPVRYHRENTACGELDPELDELQFAVLDKFIRTGGKPVFGICRGHEVLNVYFGGTLIQDIPSATRHARTPGIPEDKIHGADSIEGTFARELYGTSFRVNSSHHQAVDAFGDGLKPAMYSDDGVVEAMQHESLPVFSVQWHPERMCFAHARTDTVDGSLVLRRFLSLCTSYKEKV